MASMKETLTGARKAQPTLPLFSLKTEEQWDKYHKLLNKVSNDIWIKKVHERYELDKKLPEDQPPISEHIPPRAEAYANNQVVYKICGKIEESGLWDVGDEEFKESKYKTLFAPDSVRAALSEVSLDQTKKDSIIQDAETAQKHFGAILKDAKFLQRDSAWHKNAGYPSVSGDQEDDVSMDDESDESDEESRPVPDNLHELQNIDEYGEIQKYHIEAHQKMISVLGTVWDLLEKGFSIPAKQPVNSNQLDPDQVRMIAASEDYRKEYDQVQKQNTAKGLRWNLGLLDFWEWQQILKTGALDDTLRVAKILSAQWPRSVLDCHGQAEKLKLDYPTREEWQQAMQRNIPAFAVNAIKPKVQDPAPAGQGPHMDGQGRYYITFESQPVSTDIIKPGHTIDGHRIVACRHNHKKTVSTGGRISRETSETRTYVVELDGQKNSYVVMDEKECGGAYVFTLLGRVTPKTYLDITVGEDEVYEKLECNKHEFQKHGWGIFWVANKPWVRATPGQKPDSYIAIWKGQANGGEQKSCVVAAGVLRALVGEKLADMMIARSLKVHGQPQVQFRAVWDAYRAAAPIRPILGAEKKLKQRDADTRLAGIEQTLKQLAITYLPASEYHDRGPVSKDSNSVNTQGRPQTFNQTLSANLSSILPNASPAGQQGLVASPPWNPVPGLPQPSFQNGTPMS